MSKGTSKSWIRVYDDTYEDCIVGNKDGLKALAQAIESALESDSNAELADFTDSDVSVIHCTDDFESLGEDSSGSASLPLKFFGVVLFFWVTILPILGVFWLFQKLTN